MREQAVASSDLIELFNSLFLPSHNTVLVAGDEEPLYRPARGERRHHEVIFAHRSSASALHEAAHWCIAGRHRRTLDDYGYWYQPDGRNASEQELFQAVEVKPQALEWLFAVAAGVPFFVSIDNLSGESADLTGFRHLIRAQALRYLEGALPPRADCFLEALYERYDRRASARRFWQTVAQGEVLPV